MMSILQHVPTRTERLTLWSERVLWLTFSSFDYRRAVRAKRRQIKQIEFLDTPPSVSGYCVRFNWPLRGPSHLLRFATQPVSSAEGFGSLKRASRAKPRLLNGLR